MRAVCHRLLLAGGLADEVSDGQSWEWALLPLDRATPLRDKNCSWFLIRARAATQFRAIGYIVPNVPPMDLSMKAILKELKGAPKVKEKQPRRGELELPFLWGRLRSTQSLGRPFRMPTARSYRSDFRSSKNKE